MAHHPSISHVRPRPLPRTLTTALALAAFAFTAGCIASGSNATRVSGTPISERTVQRITPGETTKAQVLTLLGSPTRTNNINGDTVLVYSYAKFEESEGHFLLLFAGDNERTIHTTTYIEIAPNDIVNDVWTDTSE